MLSPTFQAYHERSLVSSTSWAIGAHHHFFGDPSSPGGPLEPGRFRGNVQSGEQLAGGSFPDGRLYDPITGQFGSLMTARDIAAGRTLHETHVNLETGVGKWLKETMQLPFQEHSRLDPLKAAAQAEATFGRFSQGEREGRQLLVGANVGERAVSHLAQTELHAHGIEGAAGLPWEVLDGAGQGTVPVQSVVHAVAAQGQADSLLITACNMDGRFVQSVGDLRVIQGLGKGYYHGKAREAVSEAGFGGFHSWRDAVVLHAGEDTTIYPKSAVHAELLRRGVYSGPVESGLVGIGLDTEAGAPRIGSLPGEVTRESMLKSTLPLSEAPYIHARGFDSYGQGGQYQLATGEQFGSLVEAEAALTHSIRATVDPSRLEQVSRYEASLGQAMGATAAGPGAEAPFHAASDWFEGEGARLSQAFREVTESAAQGREALGGLQQEAAARASQALPPAAEAAAAEAGERFTGSAAAKTVPVAEEAAERGFNAPGWAGIVLGGALIAGGLFMMRPDKKHAHVPHARPHTGEIAGPQGTPEGQTESTRTVRGRQPNAKFSTHITLHDAAPDWGYLDRLYSQQL